MNEASTERRFFVTALEPRDPQAFYRRGIAGVKHSRPVPRDEPAVHDLTGADLLARSLSDRGSRKAAHGGRYWDRTSGLLGVNEALSR